MANFKHWFRFLMISIFTAIMIFLWMGYDVYRSLPDHFTVIEGESLTLPQPWLSVTHQVTSDAEQANAAQGDRTHKAQISLLGIPVKTVTVTETEEQWIVPGGTPFGMKLFTSGVVVVGLSDIDTEAGRRSPAQEAGIAQGDVITAVNGKTVTASEMVSQAMMESGGAPVTMTIDRDGAPCTVTIIPAKSVYDHQYKGGLWVRDSTAGIGMVTYYCPETGQFGGLGHGICDVDTNELMPLRTGEIVPVCISGVVKGQDGDAGELKGYFTSDEVMGQLCRNDETGVYGSLYDAPTDGSPVAAAMKQDVEKGAAQILTTVDGEVPQLYDIAIESLDMREDAVTKNMVIRITDQNLLDKTGGIVQGMSGSPILQNGRLVGAVTHVFINDPTRGYGIFIENMLEVVG